MNKAAILKTQRLELKAYEECDKERMLDILCNEEIKKTYMIPDFATEKQAEELFYRLKEYSQSDEHFEYGIYLCGTLIGFINECSIENETVELGYVIHPDYRGNGYAPEALETAIHELFRMGYSHIETGFFEENPASRRVMEKCGMHKLEKQDDVEYQGKCHHCLYFGIDK